MKKNTINKITIGTALALGAVLLVSCTANFATNRDKAHLMYAYDMGSLCYGTQAEHDAFVAEYGTKHQGATPVSGQLEYSTVYYWQDYEHDYNGGIARTLNIEDNQSVIHAAANAGITCPSDKYWADVDIHFLHEAWSVTFNSAMDSTSLNEKGADGVREALNANGYLKFVEVNPNGSIDNWHKWEDYNQVLRELADPQDPTTIQLGEIPNKDFTDYYKNYINTKVNSVRSCITIDGGSYGKFGWNDQKVPMEAKDWGSAWSRGFLEGLLVWPVAAMTEIFSHAFGMNGFGQLGAILLVTIIVRSFLLLVSLKSTIGQQKMQMLQPELAKIQAKYPNATTNPQQKQRLAQEQMALYKKNKINPLGTLLVLVVQFPLFIAVWGGLQGSASLATDQIWGLYLSDSIWNTLTACKGLPGNSGGWWTAFVLVILMAAGQFFSMKLPQWLQKHYAKNTPKLSNNSQADKTQRQMKWFGYIMLVIIIIMGFTLPAAMGVYWLAGALYSIAQTTILQFAMHGTFKKQGIAIKQFFNRIFKRKPKTQEVIDVDTTKDNNNIEQ